MHMHENRSYYRAVTASGRRTLGICHLPDLVLRHSTFSPFKRRSPEGAGSSQKFQSRRARCLKMQLLFRRRTSDFARNAAELSRSIAASSASSAFSDMACRKATCAAASSSAGASARAAPSIAIRDTSVTTFSPETLDAMGAAGLPSSSPVLPLL